MARLFLDDWLERVDQLRREKARSLRHGEQAECEKAIPLTLSGIDPGVLIGIGSGGAEL
jgi:hypothetical protein